MLDQNERHAVAGREGGEQPSESIEAASRGAEPDNREAVMPERRAIPRGTPARPPRSRCARSRTLCCHMHQSYHGALHRCDNGVSRQCSGPNQDGALLKGRLDEPLLLLTLGVVTSRQHL
jgi:hypothetical protein